MALQQYQRFANRRDCPRSQLKAPFKNLCILGVQVGLGDFRVSILVELWLGLRETLGFLITAVMAAIMYTCFIFSLFELDHRYSHAGTFAYSRRAL